MTRRTVNVSKQVLIGSQQSWLPTGFANKLLLVVVA